MSAIEPRSLVAPERRVTAYYFVQAMSVGAANAFAGIWFASRGMTAEQIGVINAAPVLVILVLSLSVGRIADRADDWRRVIVIGALASGIFPVGLFFAQGFPGILVFWTLAVAAQMAVLPVADAAAMRLTRRRGSDFGVLYAWKTIGYLSVVFSGGFLLVRFGGEIFLPLFVGLALLRGAAALGLPRFRAQAGEAVPQMSAVRLLQVMKPWFLLPLAGWAMVHATHFILNGFMGLLWQKQGIAPDTIGVLIGVSGVAETAMFFAFRRFARRFSARRLILLSAAIAVVRWAGLAASPGVPVLFVLQLLHAATYALGFLACTNFIANWTREDIAAEAQSFFVMLQLVLAIVALVAFGWLAGTWGAKAYLASAALAALGALLVWISIRLTPERL